MTLPALLLPLFLVLLLLRLYGLHKQPGDLPVRLKGQHTWAISPFFTSRFDFLDEAFKIMKQPIFKIRLLWTTIVVVSGAQARKEFLMSKSLDINEGFVLLSGTIPLLSGVTSGLQSRRVATIHKRLATAQTSANLSQLLPKLLSDAARRMGTWGSSGKFDIFDCIHKVIFQTIIRSLSSHELADDTYSVDRLRELYTQMEAATTPIGILAPWFPSPSMIRKWIVTQSIYRIVNGAILKRMESEKIQDDTLQILMDNEDERMVMVGFVMGLLIAAARSTGTTASWLITFLSSHPEWRDKVREELLTLLDTHSDPLLSSQDPIQTRLASIPLEVWEAKMPVLDSILRETLRVAQPHAAMRRNVGPDSHLCGVRIPKGAYVVYPFSDVHLDSKIYPDPWKFDPTRPKSNVPYTWIGFGAGSTNCIGQRLAKLNIKLVASMLLLKFDFELEDPRTGRPPALPPQPNWNDILTCKPSEENRWMRFVLRNVT